MSWDRIVCQSSLRLGRGCSILLPHTLRVSFSAESVGHSRHTVNGLTDDLLGPISHNVGRSRRCCKPISWVRRRTNVSCRSGKHHYHNQARLPDWGRSLSGVSHTAARCGESVRTPGSWSGRWPLSAPPRGTGFQASGLVE